MGVRVNSEIVEKHIRMQLQEIADADVEYEQDKEAVINKCFRELYRQLVKLDEKHEKYCEVRMKRIEWHLSRLSINESEVKDSNEVTAPPVDDTRLLQAFNYTIFDTILFAITRGSAPDFALISQSALFETVYSGIARGYDSYLLQDIPKASIAVIYQGRSLLEECRKNEDNYLDEEDTWSLYAPHIQQWWVNTALPLLYGERDPDWDNLVFPTRDEMKRWGSSELSQRHHFPAITDLIELARSLAVQVATAYDFKLLLNA